MDELKSPDKPFVISKWAVQEVWEKVKANTDAPGVDGVSIEAFEADLHTHTHPSLATLRVMQGRTSPSDRNDCLGDAPIAPQVFGPHEAPPKP